MSKKIPTEILEQKLDKFIAANLEQAVLDQAGAEEAQTELSDRYDVKVGEVRQRLIDLGVSESIVDEVIIGHLVKEAKPVSEMAAYAAEITQNFRAAAENLENRFQATHRAFQLTGIKELNIKDQSISKEFAPNILRFNEIMQSHNQNPNVQLYLWSSSKKDVTILRYFVEREPIFSVKVTEMVKEPRSFGSFFRKKTSLPPKVQDYKVHDYRIFPIDGFIHRYPNSTTFLREVLEFRVDHNNYSAAGAAAEAAQRIPYLVAGALKLKKLYLDSFGLHKTPDTN
ncbi:MAG TPA: hypothetical protein VJC39_02535 [Candidatus Nanoarchaeia archaeon]|nr:hypothetical protein [Candidatus Nanoarchaeia archaeon]